MPDSNHSVACGTAGTGLGFYLLGEKPPGLIDLDLAFETIYKLQPGSFPSSRDFADNAILIISDGTPIENARRFVHHGCRIISVFHADDPKPDALSADEAIEWNASPAEWKLRIDRAARCAKPMIPPLSCDPKLLAMIVHDLRTPLNVIGLSLRMVENAVSPLKNPELNEDLEFLRMNVGQLERLLIYLSDYCRVLEGSGFGSSSVFSPARLSEELLGDEQAGSLGLSASDLRIEVREGCPAEVELDERKVRQAILYAIANARVAAGLSESKPINVTFRGGDGRWRIEVALELPPPRDSEDSIVNPRRFDRLSGVARERAGLDLAIVAQIAEHFGGTVRLEYEPGISSTIVLDWPVAQDSQLR